MKRCLQLFLYIALTIQSFAKSETVKKFLDQIPKEKISILDCGIRRMLKSFGGYVLYGNKPMCIENIFGEPNPSLYCNEISLSKDHLLRILKEWNLVDTDRNYLFLFTKYAGHTHLIIINKIEFTKAVNDNLSLFRYVLDPKLTAESLLSELINNQDHFYDVLKDDIALIGILLGYGTNNSIAQRQVELALRGMHDSNISFPYLIQSSSSDLSLVIESSPNQTNSWDLSEHTTYRIPCFGCNSDSEETRFLVRTYEKNRNDIIAAAEQENFLESFLERIFISNSSAIAGDNHKENERIKLPAWNPYSFFNPADSKKLLEGFTNAILNEVVIDGKDLSTAFIKGMFDCERNAEPAYNVLEIQREFPVLSTDLRDKKNLDHSEKILKRIENLNGWNNLIDKNVLYKTLKKGYGNPASKKTTSASFHYSFCTSANSSEIKSGTIDSANVELLLPGIVHLLIGMKRGEERMAYIHPRYAYGDTDPYPNEAVMLKIQLIDFVEGEKEMTVAAERSLNSKQVWYSNVGQNISDMNRRKKPRGTYRDLLAQYEELQEKQVYLNGYNFWKSIKSSDIVLDLGQLVKYIQSADRKIKDEAQRISFLFEFKAHLFHKKYLEGQIPIAPFCF